MIALARGVAIAVAAVSVNAAVAMEPLPSAAVAAVVQPCVDLLDADSAHDWLSEQAAAAGWTHRDGKLIGAAKSKPLVSPLTLGDFELHVDWKVSDGAAITLAFPKAPPVKPNQQGFEIRLAEKPGVSIHLPQGAKSLKVDPRLAGKLHRAVIKRTGDQLVLDSDGTRSRELPVAAAERFGLTLAIEGGTGAIESLRLVERAVTPRKNPR